MADDASELRPETCALDTLIRETVARARRDGTASTADALLFLGNWHQAFPALVVQDPVLEPVDKLVWMVICLSGRAAGVKAVFPSYTDIARLANVSSTSTVSRAIAILRATRWLSLCARGRAAGGRFGANVYALHDEPLPLADTLHLDSGYMAFLQEAVNHHHARVRRVVAAVHASMDEDIRAGRDVLAPVNPTARRLEAVRAIHQGGARRYFDFSAAGLASLSNSGTERTRPHQDQNSKAVGRRPQKSKSATRSSSNNNKNTTTTTPRARKEPVRHAVAMDALVLPARLEENQRGLAARYLAMIPADQHQPVLDELAGRLRAEQRGAAPVYDEMSYLHRLCLEVTRGKFLPNHALKVQGERERQRKEAEQRRAETASRERQRQERTPRPPGESPFAEIRRQLAMPPPPGPKSR
jgi:hypothetical protein